jgi:hypothetical protein
MDSRNITSDQAHVIDAWLNLALTNLQRLEARMVETHFPVGDMLMIRVKAAHEAVRLLRLSLHEIEASAKPKELENDDVDRIQ